MKVSRYWKAVVAGAGAAAAAVQDGTVTAAETVTVVLSVLGGLGFTWAVPNRPQAPAAPPAAEPPQAR
ncbi:hypothetical protein D9753_02335 [Streptomyces dangxiongensis]|uniref:Uncharacterized protein n=1 Tax=Streptomyces dangxiongensis TaxID=1442032 RepID=A0A3G2J6X3_9ACTN|nr:hypothetical protein [Streptomyces dangxiongensis]AYN37983.1 hypothetical protein D9753_02335 [Streptomyces dangxiongensis]